MMKDKFYRLFITGDRHGRFDDLEYFCQANNTTEDDALIILGDAGILYYGENKTHEKYLKAWLSRLPITLLCVRGNHEARPQDRKNMLCRDFCGGKAYYEEACPNVLHLTDGGVYSICGKTILSIGGAYSVDKELRLAMNYMWFENEELSLVEMERIYADLLATNLHYDLILTHTCPEKWIPTDMFIGGIDQSKVSRRMEIFLEGIENITDYDHWYFGHYHGNRDINDKATMLYQEIRRLV